MRTWRVATFLLGGVLLICPPLSAHHGGAAMDDMATEFKNVTVTGFAWANPHALVFFDVKDNNGNVVNCTAETSAPQELPVCGLENTGVPSASLAASSV